MASSVKYGNKIKSNLCEAIKSLSPEHKYAFAPFLSSEEHNIMKNTKIQGSPSSAFTSWIPEDQDLQTFVWGNDLRRESLKDILASAIPSKENGVLTGLYKFFKLDDARVTANLMEGIIRKAANEMAECLNTSADKLSYLFQPRGQCDYGNDNHYFHVDTENSSNDIRMTLALKGKGTAFLVEYKDYEELGYQDIVSTPDLHLAVFTQGKEFGATHSGPKYEFSSYSAFTESCSRYLIVITGTKTADISGIDSDL